MRKTIRIFAVLAAFGGWQIGMAGTPAAFISSAFADSLPTVWVNKVKKLSKNIAAAREKLAADPGAILESDFKNKQFADRIDNFRASLARVPSGDDAILSETNALLATLEAEFAAAKGGAPAPASAPETKTTTTADTAPKPAPTTAGPKSDSAVRPLVSGERVRVKKLARDIGSVRERIVTTGPSELQSPERAAAFAKRLGQFTAALKKYPQAEDPDVITARTAFLGLKEDLSAESARAKKQLDQLGDVQARLAQIDKHRIAYPLPDRLQIPFTEAEAKAWVETASATQTAAQHDLKQLRQIAPLAYLPINNGTPQSGAAYDEADLGALAGRIDHYISKVNDEAKDKITLLNRMKSSALGTADARSQGDPNDPAKRWMFLREERRIQAFEAYDEAEEAARMALSFKAALGQDTAKEETFLGTIDKARKRLDANFEIALNGSRLPEAKSGDTGMLAIAKEVLEKPRYEYGTFGPIILTTDKITQHERKESEIDIDKVHVVGNDLKLSGTETTWTYKWREFRFATPLQNDDGSWQIWWITAKNYSSGSSVTPIGEWIAGKSTEGDLILEENFR